MSDTPRTDEMTKPAGHFVSDKCSVVTAGFARELEKENAEMRETLRLLVVGDLPAAMKRAREHTS